MFGFKVGPFILSEMYISTPPIENGGFIPYQTSPLGSELKMDICTQNKEGTPTLDPGSLRLYTHVKAKICPAIPVL